MRSRTCSVRLLACLALAARIWSEPSGAADVPHRIVSLDLCTDQLLVELVARDRIAAVTHLAADPAVSAIPEKALGLPVTHGDAEDVLRRDPDLILAGPFGVTNTVNMLRRLRKNVVVVPLPRDIAGIRDSVGLVAAAVGAKTKGEALIAMFDRRMQSLPATDHQIAPTAIIYQVSGVVSGPASLANSMLQAAGIRNKAGQYGVNRRGQVPLELLLTDPPELMVLSNRPEEYRTAMADNLRHPALRWLAQHRASIELPWQLWLCGTPHIIEAIERLAQARIQLEARRQ